MRARLIEYYICGSKRTGEVTPREYGMTAVCMQQVIDAYVAKYPGCIHVNLDMALPDEGEFNGPGQ